MWPKQLLFETITHEKLMWITVHIYSIKATKDLSPGDCFRKFEIDAKFMPHLAMILLKFSPGRPGIPSALV